MVVTNTLSQSDPSFDWVLDQTTQQLLRIVVKSSNQVIYSVDSAGGAVEVFELDQGASGPQVLITVDEPTLAEIMIQEPAAVEMDTQGPKQVLIFFLFLLPTTPFECQKIVNLRGRKDLLPQILPRNIRLTSLYPWRTTLIDKEKSLFFRSMILNPGRRSFVWLDCHKAGHSLLINTRDNSKLVIRYNQ